MEKEKGQSLVEFALVLPLLILLLFGIVDFGRVFHAYLTIDHAGREAARAASIGKPDYKVGDPKSIEGVIGTAFYNMNSIISSVPAEPDITNSTDKVTGTIPNPDPELPPIRVVISPPTRDDDTLASGTDKEVTIIYNINFLTPLFGDLIGPLPIEDKTTMRVE